MTGSPQMVSAHGAVGVHVEGVDLKLPALWDRERVSIDRGASRVAH